MATPPVCVICRALNGANAPCVPGCHFASLVAQGVLTPVHLKQLCFVYNPSMLHREMTNTPPDQRPILIQSFLFDLAKRVEDRIRGSSGFLADLRKKIAEKKTMILEAEARISAMEEENRACEPELDALRDQLREKKDKLAVLRAKAAQVPLPYKVPREFGGVDIGAKWRVLRARRFPPNGLTPSSRVKLTMDGCNSVRDMVSYLGYEEACR